LKHVINLFSIVNVTGKSEFHVRVTPLLWLVDESTTLL